ncbi:hypothetical protein K502DRAFT_362930 [Neoconidiobolus thromboides FSU 785]|nr:hypothetical protein K502DRAFT_362930 [Neoconidiobolus thromboides FSU 785]
MKLLFILILIFYLLYITYINPKISLAIPIEFFNSSVVPYILKDNYIQINLNQTLLTNNFYDQLNYIHHYEQHFNQSLQNRGEAHITVITPPEYELLTTVGIDIIQLNQLIDFFFKNNTIQNVQFHPYCLGSSTLNINYNNSTITSTAYFVILSSSTIEYKPIIELINLRYFIQNYYLLNGGEYNLFKPRDFFPHITLGFTIRDLFEQDGLLKNPSTCINNIKTIS